MTPPDDPARTTRVARASSSDSRGCVGGSSKTVLRQSIDDPANDAGRGGRRKTNPYATEHNKLAVAWKQRTITLPDEAREPGVYEKHQRAYPVCLPIEFAAHNLQPEVRDGAIELFTELDIPWHDSVADGPSDHLRDSLVQCVNALVQMVSDQERIKLAFGGVVNIAEVLQIEDDRFVTFE